MQTRQNLKGQNHVEATANVSSSQGVRLDNDFPVNQPTSKTTSLPYIGLEEQAEQSQADWIQQMHDCEALGWRGGDAFYDGPSNQ